MKTNPFFNRLISILLVLCCAFAVGTLTVFAEPDEGEPVTSDASSALPEDPGENPAENPGENPAENPGENPAENPGENPPEVPGEEPYVEPTTQEPTEDYLGGWVEETTVYSEPANLGELPKAEPGEVSPASAVEIPEVTVSDASLFSGIVMWLCVALGIAVIVGVLVSKRTRRRGA